MTLKKTKLAKGTLKTIETAEHTRQFHLNAMVLQVDMVRNCLECHCRRGSNTITVALCESASQGGHLKSARSVVMLGNRKAYGHCTKKRTMLLRSGEKK